MAFSVRLNSTRYSSTSLPVSCTFSPVCVSVMPFFCASGVRSTSTSSAIGARSMQSVRGTDCRSLISSSVRTRALSRSSCSCSKRSSAAVSASICGCSAAKSSIRVCMSASGVRSSCAALPVNCRCVSNDCARRSSIALTDRLSCRNSAVVSSDRRVSVRLSSFICPVCCAKSPSGLSARPLTKYAMTALSSVTSAVMHQPMRSKRTFSALTC